MERLNFIAAHYAALVLFAFACWGCGWLAIRRLMRATPMTGWLGIGLCLSVGTAVIMLVLQGVALAGLLTVSWLLAVLGAGWLAGGFGVVAWWRAAHDGDRLRRFDLRLHWTVWLILLLSLCTVLLPLRPPYMWDELSFHLAHAQQWANSSQFQTNAWLRYPWSPFSYHLLYAAALVLYDDLMPHLLHAFAGWVTALLLYQIAARYTNRIVAGTAAVLWLALARDSFVNAYVEMAVALFLLAGWFAFTLWRDQPQQRGWLAAAAFLLGSAAATKYQALGFLPYFGVVLLLNGQRMRTLPVALLFGLLPCAYWYARNAVVTGDPFSPLGGALFGFYDWTPGDMALQLLDLKNGRGWPPALLWPALAAPLLPSSWRSAGLRAAMWFSLAAGIVWLVTSHLPRYLLPVYPLLALLAAHSVWTVGAAFMRFIGARIRPASGFGPLARGRVQGALATVLMLAAALPTLRLVERDWDFVAATPAQRAAFLDRQLWEYQPMLNFIKQLPHPRIYQHGMEAVLYYGPQPIWGDHFGPWRYSDFMRLPSEELAKKLRQLDFDTLVVQLSFDTTMLAEPRFARCFETMHRDQTFGVYRLASTSQCNGGAALPRPVAQLDGLFIIGPALPRPEQDTP